jgi:cold shock CspA family protein
VEVLSWVRRDHLQSPRNRDELFYVPDRLLTSAQEDQVTVIPVTRYGHALQGTIEGFDKDAIYMQIREHMVIVYRDGLHEFGVEEWHQGVITEVDESARFGFIESGNLPRIFVHISEILDKTVMSLQVGQKVEFDINRTIKGLSAINVNFTNE